MTPSGESRGDHPPLASAPPLTSMASTSNAALSSESTPLPATLTQDDPHAADAARQRFAKRSHFPSLPNFLRQRSREHEATRARSGAESDASVSFLSETPELAGDAPRTRGLRRDLSASTRRLLKPPGRTKAKQDVREGISLDDRHLDGGEDEYRDKFQWAVLYENQRGFTFFSIPYYSSMGLLPFDPAPFTAPQFPATVPSSSAPVNTAPKRGRVRSQGALSFNEFPLPDGTWRWLSKKWMVDMSSDTDRQVQYDGFEYNWVFRSHHWRTQAGRLSAGGFVRRRRWIRLMYRPAKARLRAEGLGVDEGQATPDESPLIPDLLSANLAAVVGDTSMYDDESEEGSSESVRNGSSDHRSWAGTWDDRTGRNYQRSVAPSLEPPSAMGTVSGSIRIMDGNPVFVGDPESDWVRCRAAMHRLKRDGRILEVWRKWLGQSQPAKPLRGNAVARQPTRSSSGISRPGPARSGQVNSDVVEPGDVPLEYVRAVLDEHILDVLQLFVYPDTKARFLDLLAMVGILPRLSMNLESIMDQTEFWSYSEGLNLAGTSSSPGGSKSA